MGNYLCRSNGKYIGGDGARTGLLRSGMTEEVEGLRIRMNCQAFSLSKEGLVLAWFLLTLSVLSQEEYPVTQDPL